MAGYELITTAPDPRTAVRAAWTHAGSVRDSDVRARPPATGGPVDYADGGIGCREPGDSFAGEGAGLDIPDAARVARARRAAWTSGCSAWTRRRLDLGWARLGIS
jgi:hypothetical protein